MAEGTQRIFELKIDQGDYEKKIAAFTTDLVKAKEAKQALDKAYKAGEVTQEEYGKQLAANKRQTNETTGELRAHTRVLELYRKSNKETSGSIKQMQAEVAVLKDKYYALSPALRESSEEGKELAARITELNESIVGGKEEVKDFTSSIGNYAGAIKSALGATGPLGEKINELTEIYSSAKEQISSIGGALKGYVNGTSAAADASQDAAGATTAMGTASKAASVSVGMGTKALRIFKVALAATGIGLIVIALGSLIAMLTKTQGGMNLVERATNAVGAVFNVLLDRAGILGEAIKELFEGNFAKSAELARKAVAGVGDEIEREIKLTDQLTLAQQRLERERINNIATNKTLLGEIEKLKNIRDNEFNSIGQRQKANEEAFKIEKKRLETLSSLQQRQVDYLRQQIDMRGGLDRATNDQLRELREAENELADLREDAYGKQNELITNRFQLEKERIEKLAEQQDRANRDTLARLEAEIIKISENNVRKLELQQKLVDKQRDIDLKAAQITEGEKLKIAAKAEADKKKLKEDFDKQTAADIKDAAEKEYQNALTIMEGFLKQQETLLMQSQAQELSMAEGNGDKINEIEGRYSEARLQLALTRLQKQKDIQLQNGQSTLDIDSQIAATQLQIEIDNQNKITAATQKGAEERSAIKEAEFEMASNITSAMGGLVGLLAGQGEEAAAFQKALAVFQIGIDTVKAISQIITLATAPTPDNLATGGLTVPVKIAGLTAVVLGNLANARALLDESTQPKAPKFDKGGYTGDGFGSPDESGYKIAGIVHENEYVAPEVVLKDPRAKTPLMQLEMLRKMKLPGYATGGMVKGIQLDSPSRQLTPDMFKSNYGAPALNNGIDYGKLAAAMAKLHVSVAVDEISSAQAHKTRTQNRASIK